MASVVPHRCYVSVELPFCLPVTTTTTTTPNSQGHGLQEIDRQLVEAFVPPSFLGPCLDEATPAENEEAGSPANGAMVEDRPQDLTMGIATPSQYRADEVFSGWRPLDFGDDASNTHAGDTTFGTDLSKLASGKRERERMLRESFPSFTPQVLLHGFYRNDALVEVTRTRCVRRTYDVVTGRVVAETSIPDDDAGIDNRVEATVVGVVSREVNITRPADFCYSPFSKEQVEAFPLHCSANLFPPAHFVAEKTPFEVECEFTGPALGKTRGSPIGVASMGEDELPTQWEFEGMPTLSLRANDPSIPPSILPAQRDLLHRLNGGENEEDCVEVRTVKKLLEERPAWIAQDLLHAILQSGVCPRMHINKKVVSCLTYIIQNGPFNRLRVRLGFDPYANRSAASLQRIAVKINRRSEIGTLLRDISRVPNIADLMRNILKKHAERRQAQEGEVTRSRSVCIPYSTRGSFREKVAKVVHGGRLYVAMQLCDLADEDDDTFIKELLARVPATDDAVMPLEKRSYRNGWIGSECYQRAASYITEAISRFIRDEVEPVLVAKGEKEGGNVRWGKSVQRESSSSTTPSSKTEASSSSSACSFSSVADSDDDDDDNDDDDDDDDDDDSTGSVSSSAVSPPGEERV